MSNGTTRLSLARMQVDGRQSGQHEYMEEIMLERKGKSMKKIPLKNALPKNHAK